jgi:hypothetical protein
MVLVKSTWTDSPIVTGGVINGPEWGGAGKIPIPAGYLLVKNNADFLYIALDLIGDKGADPGTGDYFWFSIDVDGNHQITPMKDINYGIYPKLPIKIGRQFCLGPGTWTGIINQPSPAKAAHGFGPSPNSATPHRVWELRLPLSEIGADFSSVYPIIRFGVRVASSNPKFTFDYPSNFYKDFRNLHEILLTKGPSTLPGAGPVIAGVGLIPASKIINGYATTDPSYYLKLVNYVFGRTLHLVGNHTTLQNIWNSGARKYRILHKGPSSGTYTPVRESWTNYRSAVPHDILETFGPDSQDRYPLPNPSENYSIKDLLLQWRSHNHDPGLHRFKAEFFRLNGTKVVTPNQILTLMVDNNWPQVQILDILHGGKSVPACAIEKMTSKTDGVVVRFKVWDDEGNLQKYNVTAHWGTDKSDLITTDNYANHTSSVSWKGETQKDSPLFVPPVTCAYQFRVRAWPKATNGWGTFGGVEATKHLTLIVPGIPIIPMKLTKAFPLGFSRANKLSAKGIEPKKLGTDTLNRR